MLKIGVLGAGHLGKIHIKCIQEISNAVLCGFYDPDPEVIQKVVDEFGVKAYPSIEELVAEADVVDIVTPTISHFECAAAAMKNSKHVFIEKPLVTTLEEAKELIAISNEARVKVQVGHVERFNPAYIATHSFILQPMFIETHRLALFNPRGTDVPVILDLMIHDIDIVLSIVKSNIKKISASGVPIVSDTPDIANARLEFNNGCVANLTASRISMKNMRKTRIFQHDAYISIDFLNKYSEIIRLKNITDESEINPLDMIVDLGPGKGKKQIFFEKPEIKPMNAIKTEMETFLHSIENNTEPAVSIIDGYKALDIAYKIIEKINIPD
ncbi:MAG: Gfo/Idh/MocA family oxidoreductase [Bacteroidales bacterium]|jgi:predicted dehydrogenase|nr:Gfo/Idh/MocA family oxidoreductase [Bacteroidales bacterium]MDD4214538.1 Gfo/Idh/MocA family oxidoreductase [Bacteroidales bacterium]